MGSNISQSPDETEIHALYGEYQCRCGRRWTSTLSWPNRFQKCKHCKTAVYPKYQREVEPEDLQREANERGHSQELCQRCQELGHYCVPSNRRFNTDNQPRNAKEDECVIL